MTTTASAPESSTVAQKTAWAWPIGTFFGIGKLKPGPGTWASVATVGLWRAFAPFAGGHQIPVAIAAAALVTAVGIPASTRVARESGRKDPGFVVIDEVAGQLIALIGAPLRLENSAGEPYTFSCLRHREAAAASPAGRFAGGRRNHARRRRRGAVRAGGDAGVASFRPAAVTGDRHLRI